LALGSRVKSLANYFEVCRRKRNEIDYDRAYVASDADAQEILQRACELQKIAEDWIAKHQPKRSS
jgi:hypothetical protein